MSSSYINQTIAATEAIVPVAGAGIAVTPVPSGFGLSISALDLSLTRTVRFTTGTIASGALVGPFTINFSTAFADNNYTVTTTAVINSADINPTPHAAEVVVAAVTQQVGGVGVNVWIINHDDRTHVIDIHVVARHD